MRVCELAGDRGLKHRQPHPSQGLVSPLERGGASVEPGEPLLDGGDDPLLLCKRWNRNGGLEQVRGLEVV